MAGCDMKVQQTEMGEEAYQTRMIEMSGLTWKSEKDEFRKLR